MLLVRTSISFPVCVFLLTTAHLTVSAVAVSIERLESASLTVGHINGRRPEKVFSNVLLTSGGTFTDSVTLDGDVTLTDVTVNGEASR